MKQRRTRRERHATPRAPGKRRASRRCRCHLAIARRAQRARDQRHHGEAQRLYGRGGRTKPVPAAVAEKAKQHILDTLAAMVSGADLPPGKFAINFAAALQGRAGRDRRGLQPRHRADGSRARQRHPGPFGRDRRHASAVAVASGRGRRSRRHSPAGERFGIDGNRFLRAVVLGYDIGPRFTATLGRQQYQADTSHSTHALAGTFGAAAAAGCCAGLNAQQMRWLLSYAAQQASGIASWQRDTDHIEKAFDFAGMPARNGVTAALLVQAGGTGVDDVLSGADNFFQAFKPLNNPSMLIEALGERYEVMRTDIKKWTVGSPVQAPLDALDTLIKKHRFNADAVQKVVVNVGTHEASVVDAREIPDISLQHLLAVMLVDGTVTFKSTHDVARMRDPAVLRQRAKVALVGDDELEKLLPKRVAIVEVTLADGTRGVRARRHGARHDGQSDDARRDHRESARPDGAGSGRGEVRAAHREDLRAGNGEIHRGAQAACCKGLN